MKYSILMKSTGLVFPTKDPLKTSGKDLLPCVYFKVENFLGANNIQSKSAVFFNGKTYITNVDPPDTQPACLA